MSLVMPVQGRKSNRTIVLLEVVAARPSPPTITPYRLIRNPENKWWTEQPMTPYAAEGRVGMVLERMVLCPHLVAASAEWSPREKTRLLGPRAIYTLSYIQRPPRAFTRGLSAPQPKKLTHTRPQVARWLARKSGRATLLSAPASVQVLSTAPCSSKCVQRVLHTTLLMGCRGKFPPQRLTAYPPCQNARTFVRHMRHRLRARPTGVRLRTR